jgi:hypothetical protein
MAESILPIPSVIAVLICEKVVTEALTNNKSLINVFNRFIAPEEPIRSATFWIFVRLGDAEGDYQFRLELVHLDSETAIGKAEMAINVPDRLIAHELAFQFNGIEFPWFGTYEFQIFANDIWIGRTTVSVVQGS